jgi:hypothetical protein
MHRSLLVPTFVPTFVSAFVSTLLAAPLAAQTANTVLLPDLLDLRGSAAGAPPRV